MSRRLPVALAAAALTLTLLTASTMAAPPQVFVTPLTGDEEVPARDTLARGFAGFQLSPDGETMTYILIASNIENVVASHIHIGAFGTNGPVTVFLFGNAPAGGGRHDGILATGTFTQADFIGPLAGMDMDDLVAAINAGGAYVNVHTNDGDATPNEGPGDFPGGELRGQL
ncbi:MAG: CHRD domain-containing protein [Candidatus Limnocylindria bacterium]